MRLFLPSSGAAFSEGAAGEFGVGFDGFVREIHVGGDGWQRFTEFAAGQDGGLLFGDGFGTGAARAFALGHENVGEFSDPLGQERFNGVLGRRVGFIEPAELRLTEAKGGFVAGAEVGRELTEPIEEIDISAIALGFIGQTKLNGSHKTGDGAALSGSDFLGLELVPLDNYVFVDPVEKGILFNGLTGKVVPAAQVAVEDIAGPGEGEVMPFAAETGGREEAQGDGR